MAMVVTDTIKTNMSDRLDNGGIKGNALDVKHSLSSSESRISYVYSSKKGGWIACKNEVTLLYSLEGIITFPSMNNPQLSYKVGSSEGNNLVVVVVAVVSISI